MNSRERFLAAATCQAVDRPPLWIMRQAGRFLPEYRALRAGHPFKEMVTRPELAAEVTMQPIRRYGFDAAIIFSDILVVPEAMGQPYTLNEGEGIRMDFAVDSAARVDALSADRDTLQERLAYLPKALRLTRAELGRERALIGFAGSPWTLACYMAEGGGRAAGATFQKALAMHREAPGLFHTLMEKLCEAVAAHLRFQIEAGADAVQIFDSWAAFCPPELYGELSLRWVKEIVSSLPDNVPVILFAKGMETLAPDMAATGVRVLGLGPDCELRKIADGLPANIAVQGNLAPELLDGEPEKARMATEQLLLSMQGRPGHIVNLGHGIRPTARLETVQALVEAVCMSGPRL